MKKTLGLLAVGLILWFVAGDGFGAAAEPAGSLVLEEPQRTVFPASPVEVADFALSDERGRPARFADFRGRPQLVFFGFTNCPGICPAALQKLRMVRRALELRANAPVVVLISVDGERDTPEAMRAFLEPFGDGFAGLTGPPGEVRLVADRFAAIFFKGSQLGPDRGYNVEHSSQVYLVDAAGRLQATFYNAPVADMVAVTARFSQP